MKDTDNDIDDSTAPLIEHLAELRTRIINSLIAFCIAMLFSFSVAGPIFNFLAGRLVHRTRQPEHAPAAGRARWLRVRLGLLR